MLLPAAQVGVSNNPPGCVPYNLTADAKIPRCPQQCAVQGLAGAANRTDGVRLERSEMPSLPAHACFHGCKYEDVSRGWSSELLLGLSAAWCAAVL